jgi:hypothetical protein
MDWTPKLIRLRGLLARRYYVKDETFRLVAEAGLPPDKIHFKDKAADNWHNIIAAAVSCKRLGALVEVCFEDCGDVELRDAYEDYLSEPRPANRATPPAEARHVDVSERIGTLSRVPDLADDLAAVEAIREQIKELMRTRSQRDVYLDEVMHEIDYSEVQEFLETEERRHADDGFAALCLIQKSSALGGEWCLKRIKDWLHKKRRVTPNEVVISPSGNETMDAAFILSRLAAKFAGEHPEHDSAAYTQSIVRKICGSIYLGGHLLIVIRQWEEFTDQEATLCWLLKDFWRPLVSAFRQSENRARAKLLLVVMTDLEVKIQDAAGLCCGPADFDHKKIVRLQLRNWHKSELYEWLIRHWGQRLRLDKPRADALVNRIYAASLEGHPDHVYKQAMKLLVKEAV